MSGTVTICGNDAVLLATRRMLLERAGFSIQTVLGIAGLDEIRAEILLLCYSLSAGEQADAIQSISSREPGVKILVLGEDAHEHPGSSLRSFSAFGSSHRLIESVNRLAD